jgi:hypothetical protein
MEELKRRRNIIADVLASKINLPQGIAIELCYLQLRVICELIALGCLAAHGDIPATRSGKMRKAYAPNTILTELLRLHPQFYPVPGKQVLSSSGVPTDVLPIRKGYLTKDDLLAAAHMLTIRHPRRRVGGGRQGPQASRFRPTNAGHLDKLNKFKSSS